VLAHEVAHIAHHDLRVMGLADYISRLTHLLAMTGQLMLLVMLPFVLAGSVGINLWGLVALAISPHLALLAQLGLSRTREFDADLAAARLTGDPAGLASALAKIEQVSRGWRSWLLPGWGNPDPSWLRTHPATHERIARLVELAAREPILPPWPANDFMPQPPVRVPRWRAGGLWR
jgi:heat shock protein HtpX